MMLRDAAKIIPVKMNATRLPPTSLIICSRNRPQLLRETIQSVLQGDDVPDEIVVIDQSEPPNADLEKFKTARACAVHYQHTKIAGAARARNLGICAAQNDLLVLLDDDMFVAPQWLRALIRALMQHGCKTVVTGRVLAEEHVTKNFAPSTNHEAQGMHYRGRVEQDVLYTGNMALYRSAVDEIGKFDERLGPGTRFPAAEDNDLGYRLLEAGYEIVYVPEAMVIHRAWRAAREYVPLRWSYGKGRGAFYAKHFRWRDRYMFQRMARDVMNHLIASVFALRTRREKALGDVALAFAILYGALQWTLVERGK